MGTSGPTSCTKSLARGFLPGGLLIHTLLNGFKEVGCCETLQSGPSKCHCPEHYPILSSPHCCVTLHCVCYDHRVNLDIKQLCYPHAPRLVQKACAGAYATLSPPQHLRMIVSYDEHVQITVHKRGNADRYKYGVGFHAKMTHYLPRGQSRLEHRIHFKLT